MHMYYQAYVLSSKCIIKHMYYQAYVL